MLLLPFFEMEVLGWRKTIKDSAGYKPLSLSLVHWDNRSIHWAILFTIKSTSLVPNTNTFTRTPRETKSDFTQYSTYVSKRCGDDDYYKTAGKASFQNTQLENQLNWTMSIQLLSFIYQCRRDTGSYWILVMRDLLLDLTLNDVHNGECFRPLLHCSIWLNFVF